MTVPITNAQGIINELYIQLVEAREARDAAIDRLDDGCKVYCRWYDKSLPMSGETVAYEMVSCIRQALRLLREEDDAE